MQIKHYCRVAHGSLFQFLYFHLFLLHGEKLHIYDNVFKTKKINIKPRMKFITAQHYYIRNTKPTSAFGCLLNRPFNKPGINLKLCTMSACKYKLSLQWIIKCQGLCMQNIIIEHCL